jgi:hypothetical protein
VAGEDEDAATLPGGLEDLFPTLLLPEGTGLPVLAWIRDVLEREHGLPPPPVPRELIGRVRALAPGLVTTRKDELGPYELRPFLDELTAGSPAPYLLLGTAGHGIDAWAMHYYLVSAHLGLFIQLRFGGAYGDLERERARVASNFAVAEDLVLAPGFDRLAEGQRLVVVASDLAGWRWGVIGAGGTGLKAADDPLGDALAWLERAVDPAAAGGLAEVRPWPIWG